MCIIVFQIEKEFHRISTVPLISTFFAALDRYTPRLIKLFQGKGGAQGRRIRHVIVDISKVCIKELIMLAGTLCYQIISIQCGSDKNCSSVDSKGRFQNTLTPMLYRLLSQHY